MKHSRPLLLLTLYSWLQYKYCVWITRFRRQTKMSRGILDLTYTKTRRDGSCLLTHKIYYSWGNFECHSVQTFLNNSLTICISWSGNWLVVILERRGSPCDNYTFPLLVYPSCFLHWLALPHLVNNDTTSVKHWRMKLNHENIHHSPWAYLTLQRHYWCKIQYRRH